MTTASASREVAFPRSRVWRALAVLQPYCAVCDVSYVVDGAGTGMGTQFVCVPGRTTDLPDLGAPRGEIIEWRPESRVTTRLELTPETWTTTIDLADVPGAGTHVTITLTNEPRGGGRLRQLLQRRSLRRFLRQTLATELGKVSDHVRQADQLTDDRGTG